MMVHKNIDNNIIQSNCVTTSESLSQCIENTNLTLDSDISLNSQNTSRMVTRPRSSLKKPKRFNDGIDDEIFCLRSRSRSKIRSNSIINECFNESYCVTEVTELSKCNSRKSRSKSTNEKRHIQKNEYKKKKQDYLSSLVVGNEKCSVYEDRLQTNLALPVEDLENIEQKLKISSKKSKSISSDNDLAKPYMKIAARRSSTRSVSSAKVPTYNDLTVVTLSNAAKRKSRTKSESSAKAPPCLDLAKRKLKSKRRLSIASKIFSVATSTKTQNSNELNDPKNSDCSTDNKESLPRCQNVRKVGNANGLLQRSCAFEKSPLVITSEVNRILHSSEMIESDSVFELVKLNCKHLHTEVVSPVKCISEFSTKVNSNIENTNSETEIQKNVSRCSSIVQCSNKNIQDDIILENIGSNKSVAEYHNLNVSPVSYKILHFRNRINDDSDTFNEIRDNNCHETTKHGSQIMNKEPLHKISQNGTASIVIPTGLRNRLEMKDFLKSQMYINIRKRCALKCKADTEAADKINSSRKNGTKYDLLIKYEMIYLKELLQIQSKYFNDYLCKKTVPDLEVVQNNIYFTEMENLLDTKLELLK